MLDRILIGSSAEPSDPNFKNVTLLLHGDGSNGAQNNTFIDSSTNNFTITRNGNTTQGSFSPYGSNWSNYFDGNGDYLSVAYSSAFNLTGDFTVECWINCSNLPSSTGSAPQSFERIFSFGTYNAANSIGLEINSNDGGAIRRFRCWYNGTQYDLSANDAVTVGVWTHIALVRSGTTITLYVNGVSTGNTITGASAAINTSQALYVGSLQGFEGNTSACFNGYISNFRVVKGTAVYTANFTPSTTPLTAITNTSLLTCADNRFRDGSANNFTITRNGDVKVTNFAPFAPSSAYSTATNGGSAYFDGSGDYLSVARNTAFIPTTGDFTIEAWVYPTTSGTTRFIMGLLEQGTAGDWSIFLHTNDTLGFFAGGADSFGGTVTPYQWNHVAISRSGSTIYKCVNGTATTATFTNSLDSSTGYNLTIGADNAGDEILFYGWMTDARVVKGTAIYTSTTYTVPTAPLTAVTNTGFLAKFQNAAIFDNSMKNDLETVGNAQISTSVKKFGTGSIYLDGNGDYLTLPPNSDGVLLGAGSFTIEFWINPNSSQPSTRTSILSFGNGFTTNVWAIQLNNTSPSYVNRIQLWAYNLNSGAVVAASTGTISASTWTHVAVVRNGSNFTIYINGVADGTGSSSASMDGGSTTLQLQVGYNSPDYYAGYIDDLRITKGVARYTANFTPPTAPFPNK